MTTDLCGRAIDALRRLGLVLILVVSALWLASSAGADVGDVGYQDASYAGTTDPTGTKRNESALWWNDGSWWAVMWDASLPRGFYVFRLDRATQRWTNTGTALDSRAQTRPDVLWDGSHLYVSSHKAGADTAGYPSYLYRLTYEGQTRTYSRDAGFPVQINNERSETLVLDKDSTGKLWATWMQDNQIYINRTVGSDASWGTPFVLPVSGANVSSDDISSVIAFGKNKIGVMWSNEISDAMYFAIHQDGQADKTWQQSRTAIQGPNTSDDHISLKSLEADGSGRVFAAIKTSLTNPNSPLIMLLARDAATGAWTSYPVGRVSDCHTRPLLTIDDYHRQLHIFATGPDEAGTCPLNGTIYEKTSPLDSISFTSGLGKPVIRDADSTYLNNASSTKQNVSPATGLVILAVNQTTKTYWHHYDGLQGDTSPPTAPTGLVVSDRSTTSVSLTWSAASDDVGVSGYRVVVDGTTVGETAQTSYIISGLVCGASYSVSVVAFDAAGNISQPASLTAATSACFLFTDDFETGTLARWDTVTGLTVQSAIVASGSFAARGTANTNAAYATATLPSGQTELYYRFRFYVVSQGSTGLFLGRLRRYDNVSILGVSVNSASKLSYYNSVTGVTTTSSTVATAGAWHTLLVHVVIADVQSQVEMWLDGVKTIGKIDSLGSAPVRLVQLGENASGKTFDVAFDDVVVDSATLAPQ